MITQVKRGWRADFWLGTNRVREVLPSRQLAKIYEVTKRMNSSRVNSLRTPRKTEPPFKAFVEEYYRLYAAVNMVNPKTNEFYRLEQFKKFFGDKPLYEVKSKDIEEWKADMAARCQPATFNRAFTALKGLLNKAVEWGRLNSNPAQKIGKLREKNERVRYLTEQEISKVLEAATPRLRDFTVLALNTGMRKANLIGLAWQDIDFRGGVIHVLRTKSGKAYEVPLNNVVLALLKRLSIGGTTGRVLDTCNLKREWEAALEASSVKDCRIHDLRHTFASHLAMKGIDLFTIAQLLGHADIKMTQHYAHLAPNHKKIAVNMVQFGQAREPAETKVQPEYSAN